MIFDSRQLLGVGVWEKPLKFSVSFAIYAVTWSWLIGLLSRFRRIAWWAGTASAVTSAIELVIIVVAAAAGNRSHFNVASPFETALWSVMAASIAILWIAMLVVAIILFRNDLGDRARTLAVRSGAILALGGMALAFLMTGPTAEQLKDFRGIAGAHAVGVADGGPGLPILGWSTVAGDLRVPHFVGMHALQLIPLALIVLELVSRRIPVLRDVTVRARLIWIGAVGYAAAVVVLTWQALRGQSIVSPDTATLAAGCAVVVAASVAAVVTLVRGRAAARLAA